MFKHIGRKIKGLAKFFFWLTVIGCALIGLLIILNGPALFANESQGTTIFVLIGIGVIIAGIIIAWFQNFLLYGFGELIDSNQKILEILQEKNNKNE